MKNYLLIFNQLLIAVCSYIRMKFYNLEVVDSGVKFDKNAKYLIISNHQTQSDPFIITPFLPIFVRFKLLPYRYLITDNYLKKRHLRYFLYLCGCFSTSKEKNNDVKPLKLAQEYINKNQTVFIFPEGRLNPSGKIDKSIPIGVGAIYLERENSDLYLLPVKIEYFEGRKIKITYKKPFRHKMFPKDLTPLAKDLIERIYE